MTAVLLGFLKVVPCSPWEDTKGFLGSHVSNNITGRSPLLHILIVQQVTTSVESLRRGSTNHKSLRATDTYYNFLGKLIGFKSR